VAYTPFHRLDKGGTFEGGTFVVRTSTSNPRAVATIVRGEVSRARPEFRVSEIRVQEELIRVQTVRERLLAMLGLLFALVALLLAGIGLYGVLDYSVFQRRREIGIRMAIGAQAYEIAWCVAVDVVAMVFLGAIAGVGLGLASARYIETLLYQVEASSVGVLAISSVTVVSVGLLAAMPALVRAVLIDPTRVLRCE
jgi:ABC-type antimicrobial peptide transport system permease subunit